METSIYLDECGFTGDDLLHADQPVFVIATHNVSDVDCRDLRDTFFAGIELRSLKHKVLARRKRHQEAVVAFLREFLKTRPSNIKIGVAHKRYALALKLVDLAVEPSAYRAGSDMYRTDFMRTFGTLLYFVLQAGELNTLDRILKTFQTLVRRRTNESLRDFQASTEIATGMAVQDEILELLRGPIRHLRLSDITHLQPSALDLTLTVALQCVIGWRKSGYARLRIRHDRSSAMARHKALWDAFVSPEAPPALIGYGAEGVQFPLGVETTEFVSSDSTLGVQIADIFAGAFARHGRWLASGKSESDEYASQLDTVIAEFATHALVWVMWPFPDVVPEPTAPNLGDALDYLTERAASTMRPSPE